MGEMGILSPGVRVELLNGAVIDLPRIEPFHGGVTNHLNEMFHSACKRRWQTRVRNPVRLDDHSEPQPDIVLARPASDFYRRHHPKPEEVFLLVEVSDSTIESDHAEKIPAYGRAGIAEVWIVNLNELTVEVYREPNFTGYGSKIILRPGEQAAPLAFPDVTVDVAELLRR